MDNENEYDLDVICGMYQIPIDGIWPDEVIAYHITHIDNIQSILDEGLRAKECKATMRGGYRQSAIYLFASQRDAHDAQIRKFLFGDADDLIVLRITIPQAYFHRMRNDGLFNMSCICSNGSYPFGTQYLGDIPPNWIEIIEADNRTYQDQS